MHCKIPPSGAHVSKRFRLQRANTVGPPIALMYDNERSTYEYKSAKFSDRKRVNRNVGGESCRSE